MKDKELYLDEKEFKTKLGTGNTIFVGSSIDMFAKSIPKKWILKVLQYCNNYPGNTYIFQTKNPERFFDFDGMYPPKKILGITLETNRPIIISKAPSPEERVKYFSMLAEDLERFITIEPILEFDLKPFAEMIKKINPTWVNIGADSKSHGLNEPTNEKIKKLICSLKTFTEIKIKNNLYRLLNAKS